MNGYQLTGMARTSSAWINQTQMTSVGALSNQFVFALIVTVATIVASIRFLDRSATPYLSNANAELRKAAIEVEDKRSGFGKEILLFVLGAVIGKIGINAGSNHGNRRTSREFMAGQAAIKQQEAKVETAKAETARITAEHEVVPVPAAAAAPAASITNVTNVAAEPKPVTTPTLPVGGEKSPAEPDAYADDERGEDQQP